MSANWNYGGEKPLPKSLSGFAVAKLKNLVFLCVDLLQSQVFILQGLENVQFRTTQHEFDLSRKGNLSLSSLN